MSYTASELGLTADEMRAVIDEGYRRYPTGYDFRITKNPFTRGELQARSRRPSVIVPGWFHVAWSDDVLQVSMPREART